MTKYAYEYGRRFDVKTPRGSIGWLVDRLHVGQSDAEVTALIESRIPGKPEFTAKIRAECIAYALERHARNRALYRRVMSGG